MYGRGCFNKNSISTTINHDASIGNSPINSNVDFFPPYVEVRPEGNLAKILDLHDCQGEGSSSNHFAKCTERRDCCMSGLHTHDFLDEKSLNSSEAGCPTLHSSENTGTSRYSLKDDESAPSSIGSPNKIRPEGHRTGSNLHGSVGGEFTHIYQTNGHIHDHTHDHTHDHKYRTPHSLRPPKFPGEPPSKAEYLFGALVPHPPTYSSPQTPIPEHLVYKPEPPKKAFISPAGIGLISWNRPRKSKQGSLGNVSAPESRRVQIGLPMRTVQGILWNADTNQANVTQEISGQESTEPGEAEDGLSRPEILENVVTNPICTAPRQPCDASHAIPEKALKTTSVRFENSEEGNLERIDPKSPVPTKKLLRQVRFDESETRQEEVITAHRLPQPTHILPPTLNSSPGFSGFLWHDETGFLNKKVLEERYQTTQVLTQLLPKGYVQSRDRPSKAVDSAEQVRSPVEHSTDTLEAERPNLAWESFEFLLTDYRIVCLVDDSLSMSGPPWLLASEIVPQIAPLCAKYSCAEGADIRFVNSHFGKTDQAGLDPRDVRTTEKASNLFPRTPEGKKNPMGLELNKILSPYVRRWKQHGFCEEKPVDVIILTASAPSDYKVCVKSITDITKELDRLGAPPAQICIQFFQLSNVPAVTNDLKRLSEELIQKCAGRKIVGTFLWNEQVEVEAWSAHVILDCVRKTVDRKIFAAPTKTITGSKVPSCKCCT